MEHPEIDWGLTSAQWKILQCKAPEQLIVGGLGSAKTAAIGFSAYSECCKYKNNIGCIATSTNAQLERAIPLQMSPRAVGNPATEQYPQGQTSHETSEDRRCRVCRCAEISREHPHPDGLEDQSASTGKEKSKRECQPVHHRNCSRVGE